MKNISYLVISTLMISNLFFSCSKDDETTAFTANVSITASVSTGVEGTSNPEFIISLDKSNQSGSSIQISYAVSGSADSGSDFSVLSGVATIPVGQQQATVSIVLTDDSEEESDETIVVTLSSTGLPTGINLSASNTVTLTIVDNDGGAGSNDIAVLASLFYNSSSVTFDIGSDVITITTTDEPDHKSMYYPTSHALYEAYDEPSNPDFMQNPNEISAQNYVLKIPRFPAEATSHIATDLDAFGVAVNGVVFYNQQAAPGDDILEELNTFDQYEGHPQQQGAYHYHIEPVYLTQTISDDAFLGVLLDGFPVYGPVENGITLTNDDLDDYHGHSSATEEFPDGIYHYHITEELPWINGGEFYGTPGTWTN